MLHAGGRVVDRQPKRLQLLTRPGFDYQAVSRATNGLPGYFVDWPSRWGNPFVMAPGGGVPPLALDRRAPTSVPEPFADDWSKRHTERPGLLGNQIHQYLVDLYRERCLDGLGDMSVLAGCNLFCSCMPWAPCHADILLELANRGRVE